MSLLEAQEDSTSRILESIHGKEESRGTTLERLPVTERVAIERSIKNSEIRKRRNEATDPDPEAQASRRQGTPKTGHLTTGATKTDEVEEEIRGTSGGRTKRMAKISPNSRSSRARTKTRTGIGTMRPMTEGPVKTNTPKEIGRSTRKEKTRMTGRRTGKAATPETEPETKMETEVDVSMTGRRGTKINGERRRGATKEQTIEIGKDHRVTARPPRKQAPTNGRPTITPSKTPSTRANLVPILNKVAAEARAPTRNLATTRRI